MSEWREIVPPRGLPNTTAFQRLRDDGMLSVFVSHEPHGMHMSISHKSAKILDPSTSAPAFSRYPTWDEMREARTRFLPQTMIFMMVLPGEADYIAGPPGSTVFHLWELPKKFADSFRRNG